MNFLTLATIVTASIGGWFIGLGLFFPRITLLITWLFFTIPSNDVPFFLDILGVCFFPRALIAYYIYFNYGFEGFWAFLIVIFCFFEFMEKLSSSVNFKTK